MAFLYLGSLEIFIVSFKNIEILGRCVGTGLIALDAILNGKPTTPAKLYAGGSCGNVLTILSFLGWTSYPIGRLAINKAADIIIEDLEKWGVDTALINKEEKGSTPVIIHRIFTDKKGNPKHKFEFKDPESKKWLPSYRPLLARNLSSTIEKLPSSDVFYFDRVNRASIELAKFNYNKGTLVFFEPSSAKDLKLFSECLQYTHILKFSNERIKGFRELYTSAQVPLEIETLGEKGLSYRFKSDDWETLNAYEIDSLIDSAGAGDWSSAGIIDKLGQNGLKGFNNLDKNSVVKGLKFGQLLGAINCQFDGARGIMYRISSSDFTKILEESIDQESLKFNSEDYKEIAEAMIQVPQLSSIL